MTEHNHRMVTLHTGQTVSSWSEEWRIECEAMHVLDLPKHRRIGYLDDAEKNEAKHQSINSRPSSRPFTTSAGKPRHSPDWVLQIIHRWWTILRNRKRGVTLPK